MKNSLRALIIATALFLALSTSISTAPGSVLPVLDQSSAAAQVTPLDEEPDDAPGLGSIVGSPDAGPDPEDPGDRGGYAQLGLALVLFAGVAFIASRIVRDARRAKDNASTGDRL